MIIDLSLILVMGVLYAVGVYLILDRSMTRVLLGLMLMTNATNILILHAGGPAGLAPFYDKNVAAEDYSDPLPQALILTAIVISCAVTALVLGIIYRSWLLSKADEITDDAEDIRVAEQDAFDKEEDAAAEFDSSEFDADEETREKEFAQAEEKKKISQTQAQPLVARKGD
ncbi:Na(+)/H(+) antiporter subunit C [Rothia nasimurium]|uniref:Na(+)/H(+) antiporter subunit C n=1 Tax=Rothia nasimurium TaxID=85336 RepID=UPI001F2B2D9D|nr:Na(+)/H(+) antiporter subunit C [Rothia nasimurium]